MADFYIRQNDTEKKIEARLQDVRGTTPDLTGATCKFLMRNKDTGAVKVNQPATIVAATTADVEYSWAAADTDTVGTFEAEFEATLASGKKLSFPNKGWITVEITDDIA
jgi:hypothetical protein